MPTLSIQPLHREPPELTDEMTKQDLLEVLENLSWGHGNNSCCCGWIAASSFS
jgi:hypothetical protein